MNQNVCPSCGRRLQPGQKCPHCSDCRAHGERYTVRNQSPEQTVNGGLSMWAYMGLILLAMVPVIGLIFMIVWACGVSSNPQLARFEYGYYDNFDDSYNYNFGDDYNAGDNGDLFGDDWPDFYGEEAPAANAA